MVIFIINILVIFGIKTLFADDMLLSDLKYSLFNLRSKKMFKTPYLALGELDQSKVRFLFKPLFVCPPCMSSIWGTIGFFFNDYPIYYLPVYVFALCGAIYLIIQFMPE